MRWADSYDLDEFEQGKHHRCPSCVEPIIHAGAKQFIDFAFIFEPNSQFYHLQQEGIDWCVHPFYQWLPAYGENAMLPGGDIYDVHLAISAENFSTVRFLVQVDCRGSMPLRFPSDCTKIVGLLDDERYFTRPQKRKRIIGQKLKRILGIGKGPELLDGSLPAETFPVAIRINQLATRSPVRRRWVNTHEMPLRSIADRLLSPNAADASPSAAVTGFDI
ncbi:MAG TPA: hypothetical protein VG345_06510 [Bryobacteraceae bacterium]|nr:hypothetical protein [Bryobacteraceae bacterium]